MSGRPAAHDNQSQVALGPLADSVGYLLRQAQLISFKSFQDVFGPVAITPAQFSVLLLIDLVEQTCTLFTEPKGGEYSVRQIVKFGEPLLIPAGDAMVELPTGNF